MAVQTVCTAGTNAVLAYDYSNYLAGEFFEVEATEGQVIAFVVLTEDRSAGDVVVTIAKAVEVVEPEEPAQPSGTQNDPFIISSLPYSHTVTGLHDFYIQYTVEEDCTLVISYTGGYISGLPGSFNKDSAAKTYTGAVTAGQVLLMNPWIMSSAADTVYTYTFAKQAAVEPEPEPDPEPDTPVVPDTPAPAGSGTKADPYLAETLPFSYSVTGSKDFYIKFVATEDCTIMISYPSGNYVSDCPSNFNKDAANCNYSGTVTAGQVIVFNPWGNNAGTYTISKVVAEEPAPDEGETEVLPEGVVLYTATGTDGRGMKVYINATEGTASIIRAKSNGSFEGADEVIYTYSYVDGVVTATRVSGAFITVTWTADGGPDSVAWYGNTYSGFVKA